MANRFAHPPVLLYHGIDELAETRVEAVDAFDHQMAYLARAGYRSLTPDQFVQAADEGSWPSRSVFLTFDDGFSDFRDVAWPILRRHGMTATMFVVVNSLECGTASWLTHLPSGAPSTFGWEEMREMRSEGVFFGSHGLSHVRLATVDAETLAREVAESKARIEDGLGEEIALLSYPHGSCSDEVRSAVEAAGYAAAFGVSPKRTQRYEIFRRIVKPSRTSLPFRLRVSRAYEPLKCLKHLGRGESC